MELGRLESNITELLRFNDCVIIPGFGGFLARYSAARINSVNNRIYPPTRSIGFNRKLVSNDGLLASFLAEKEGVDLETASQRVIDWSKVLNRELEQKARLELEGIGNLIVDSSGHLLFEPAEQTDIWDEGYGLRPVLASVTPGEEKRKRQYPEKTSRIPYRRKSRVPVSVKMTLAVAVPIILFLAYGIFNPSGVKQFPANYSSLVNFENWTWLLPAKADNTRVAVVPQKLQPHSYKASIKTIIPKIREQARPAFIDLYNDIPEISGSSAKTISRYYIIGASFTDRNQAWSLAEELKYNGYQPALISDPSLNRYRVSYGSSASRQEALRMLASLRENVNAEAWLLKK